MIPLYILISYVFNFFFIKYMRRENNEFVRDRIAIGLAIIFSPIAFPYLLFIMSIHWIIVIAERIGWFVTRD